MSVNTEARFNNGGVRVHPAQMRDASAGLIGSNEKMLDRVLMYWETYVAIYFKRVFKI